MISETARWVASARAAETRSDNPLFTDYLAEEFLRRFPPNFSSPSAPVDFFIIRTRFFDDYLRSAAGGRRDQVVLLAAGLDTRAFRLPWPPGTRLFELDLPGLLREKEAVLRETGARPRCVRTVVPADLTDAWPAALRDAGFDPSRPTAWLIEGVLYYLTTREAEAVLAGVSELSAPGSALGLEHIGTGVFRSPLARPWLAELERRGVAWRSGVDDPEGWLARYGWRARVRQPSDPDVAHGRWTAVPAPSPDGPRTWLVTATRDAVHDPPSQS